MVSVLIGGVTKNCLRTMVKLVLAAKPVVIV